MLSHYHGQVINYSEISKSFGLSDATIRRYIDILEKTFMIRLMYPWHTNTKKRLVKRPKIYLRDSGIFHCLQTLYNMEALTSHPKLGASWEGFALECILGAFKHKIQKTYFWATHSGAELDIFWQYNGLNWGIEIKYSDAPTTTKSMHSAISDLNLEKLWIVYPGKEIYDLHYKIKALPLNKLLSHSDIKCFII
jgi:predicted AAA+ superfamily ATPase